jgi:hypothetical protein
MPDTHPAYTAKGELQANETTGARIDAEDRPFVSGLVYDVNTGLIDIVDPAA